MPALAIEGVSHAFGSRQALKDVALEVPEGSFTALLGVNGAGKTTLFNLITRLYDNTSGSIRVCGHDVRTDPRGALSRLGVVFQSRALDGTLTVSGGDGQRVDTLNSANFPTPGGLAGPAGGGGFGKYLRSECPRKPSIRTGSPPWPATAAASSAVGCRRHRSEIRWS